MEISNKKDQKPKPFILAFLTEDEHGFPSMTLKTMHNQINGYQEVVEQKQRQTSQEQRSWQQFFGMLKAFCFLTFWRDTELLISICLF